MQMLMRKIARKFTLDANVCGCFNRIFGSIEFSSISLLIRFKLTEIDFSNHVGQLHQLNRLMMKIIIIKNASIRNY